MRRDVRKSLILVEWDRWLRDQHIDPSVPTARDTLKFFYDLEDQRSPLLDFRPSRGDKWQVIHTCPLNKGAVLDCGLPSATKKPRKNRGFFARPAITGHFFFRRDLS